MSLGSDSGSTIKASACISGIDRSDEEKEQPDSAPPAYSQSNGRGKGAEFFNFATLCVRGWTLS